MPAGTPTRHVAFVQQKNDTTLAASQALAARCRVHAGTNFEGYADGTLVVGTRLLRGPTDPDGLGKYKMQTVYRIDGTALESHEHFTVMGSTRCRRQTAFATGGFASDTGGAEGWINLTFRFTAVPGALSAGFYGFRCRASGPAATDSRLDEANNFVTNGWGIKAVVSDVDITIALTKNGTVVKDGVLPLPKAGEIWQAEVRCTGKGTASDPSVYGVWVNGQKRLSHEDPADEYAAQTWFYICDKETAGLESSTQYDNFWFANTPNNPGAMPMTDFFEANDFVPLSSEKAGDKLDIILRWGLLLAPADPLTEARVALLTENGTLVWERAVTDLRPGILFLDGVDGAEAIYLTHNGKSPTDATDPGLPRSGAYILRARIIRTDAVTPFDLTSEGAGTPQTGTTHNWTRGYGVGSTKVTAVSVPTMPGWNEQYRITATIEAQPYSATEGKIRFSTTQSQPAGRGGAAGEVIDPLDTVSWTLNADNTATLASEPFTFDNRYAPAELAVGVGLVGRIMPALNNDPRLVFHAGPTLDWATENPIESISNPNAFTADPRIFVGTLLQINDPDWATPPMSKSVGLRRLTQHLGFLASRMSKKDGTGLNGITVDRKLWDARGLIGTEAAPVKQVTGSVTTSQGGEAGWQPNFLVWDNVLPTGDWIGKRTITAPAGAVGMEDSPYVTLSLSAVNPDYSVIVGAGHPAAVNQSEHWHPGDDLLIGAATYNLGKQQLVAVDATPAPSVVIGRFNTTFGVAQYLAADFTWQVLSGVAEAYQWPLSKSPGDPNVWVTQIAGANTKSWSHSTLFFVANVRVSATPYSGTSQLDAPGTSSPHGRAYQVMTSGGPTSKPDHWSPGMTFQAGLTVVNMSTATNVTIDGYKQIALFRLQDGGLNAGMGEFLDVDGTWKSLLDGATPRPVYFHDVAETRPGSKIYIKNFTDTANWGTYDIFVMARCKIGFFEFNNFAKEVGVGAVNQHSKHVFDGPGFTTGFFTR